MKKAKAGTLNNPWASSSEDILTELNVTAERGLSSQEARTRMKLYGPNRLQEPERKSGWLILIDQFKNLMTVLLSAAAVLSFAFADLVEGFAITAVIIINGAIGFFTELRAIRSMEALYKLSHVHTNVRRDETIKRVPALELVPGDIVVLEGGDIVTTDLRLIQASKLQADESSLTGESVPVSKHIDPLASDVILSERSNMLFKGTAVTRGSGEGVVIATGMDTELGKIASLAEEAEEEKTPLEIRLETLGRTLIWITLAIAVLVAAIGIYTGEEFFLMIETSIALAVAAVPEGLPIVATIALARGMWRMAKRNALINRLSAVETLGVTSIICTDKTGTLTENRMTVVRIVLADEQIDLASEHEDGDTRSKLKDQGKSSDIPDNEILTDVLKVGILCNNASLPEDYEKIATHKIGDPMEVALLIAGARAGIARKSLVKRWPEVREEAFDPDVKMMATFHQDEQRFRVAVKGAPEAVLDVCTSIRTRDAERAMTEEDRAHWIDTNRSMAHEGLRILAMATKMVDEPDAHPYENLVFLGLVGLSDPPRDEVKPSIQLCHEAGIRVVMVTGDQPATALSIGKAIGLIEDPDDSVIIHGKDLKSPDELSEKERELLMRAAIFARVSPKQKIDLIELYQSDGSVVAMTGDGVNDAPALKKADIGIAMGKRGTQVAREAADMVLKDDSFASIVAAVRHGRAIFRNIRKFILYLLSCNVSEIMTVSIAALFQAPLPLLPLQILFLNLVTDVFPALALGVGKGNPEDMKRPPRDPEEPLLTASHWKAIGAYGGLITLSVLGSLALALKWLSMNEREAVTVSFLTLSFAQLWHVFNMRDHDAPFFRNDIVLNRFIWGALILCIVLLLAAVYFPGLSRILDVVSPSTEGWLLIVGMSLIPLVVGQIAKSRLARWIIPSVYRQ